MKQKFKEFRFLVFFIPIYFCKLLNITPSSKWFIVLSVFCFASVLFGFVKEGLPRKKIAILFMIVFYTGLMVITCGKQGPFFSVIIILALYGIEDKRRIYNVSFWVGILAVLVSCYIERNGAVGIRYMGGEWTGIYKRLNILYISFIAVVSLYLFLIKDKTIKVWKLIAIFAVGYGMYKYSGSRTELVILCLLEIMLFAFRFKCVQKNMIIKTICVYSLIIMMLISCVLVWSYEKSYIFTVIDNMLQGRIRQGSLYFNRYNISVFGQRLYQSNNSMDFWNLDCAYYYMLLGYGLIFTVVWLWTSCGLIKYLYNNKCFIEVSIVVMYAVYGITETFLPNGFLNVSIFLYAEYLYYLLDKRKHGVSIYENKNNCNVSAPIS